MTDLGRHLQARSGERSTTPLWARAAAGALVGLVYATLVGAVLAAIFLALWLIAPSLGADRTWRAAVSVIGCNAIVAITIGAWRGVRRGAR